MQALSIQMLALVEGPLAYRNPFREPVMAESILSTPDFHNEEAAYAYVEARIWPRGPVCRHCGGVEKSRKMQGKSTGIGVYKCHDCRKPFTVNIGTIFEDGHIPYERLAARYLPCRQQQGFFSIFKRGMATRSLLSKVRRLGGLGHPHRNDIRYGKLV